MAFKVRKLDNIISDEIDTSEYGSKQEILDAARKIQKKEQEWRDEELADEREMKRQEKEAKDLYARQMRSLGKNPKTGLSHSERKRVRRSGTFKACNGLFGCRGTGWKHNLPHARCRGTGSIKVSKSKRRAIFKKKRKQKRKSFWGSKRRRR